MPGFFASMSDFSLLVPRGEDEGRKGDLCPACASIVTPGFHIQLPAAGSQPNRIFIKKLLSQP